MQLRGRQAFTHASSTAIALFGNAGTIKSRQDAVDYLTWTFFIRWRPLRPLGSAAPAAPGRCPPLLSFRSMPMRPPFTPTITPPPPPPHTHMRRRLLQNPSYYDLDSTEPEAVSAYLSALVEGVLAQLQDAGCLEVRRGGRDVRAWWLPGPARGGSVKAGEPEKHLTPCSSSNWS